MIIGYSERAAFHEDMAVLCCYGTAAIVDLNALVGVPVADIASGLPPLTPSLAAAV